MDKYIFTQLTSFVLLLQFYIDVSQCNKITVYSEANWMGHRESLNVSTCSNISSKLLKQVSSVRPTKFCVRLYNEENCTGKFIELLPYDPYRKNLQAWDFDNLAASIGPCGDPCDVEITGALPPESGLNVTIYDRSFYRGAMSNLNVTGCTILPRKFNKAIRTIHVTDGSCVEIYNNPECKYNGTIWTGDSRESIEIRQGSPFLDTLDVWLKKIKVASSISHCSYKCNKNQTYKFEREEPTLENPVIFYDDVNFTGNALPIRFTEFNKCFRLNQFEQWEGKSMSVKLYEEKATCVVLYDDVDCNGAWKLVLSHSEGDLGTEKYCTMDGKNLLCPGVRSLLFCDPNDNKSNY